MSSRKQQQCPMCSTPVPPAVAPAAPLLHSLPELALAAIIEQLPPCWRGDLRATCKKLQKSVDAAAVRRVVVGDHGLLAFGGLSSVPLRFKAAEELLFSLYPAGPAGSSIFEAIVLPRLEPLPSGCLPKVNKVGWHGPVHKWGMTLRTAAQLLRVCPNLRTFGGMKICGPDRAPDAAAQITSADLRLFIASDSLEELHVYQPSTWAAAAELGSGGTDDGAGAARLNWLPQLPNLRRLAFQGVGREVLISALPALTALTSLTVCQVEEQAEEAPLPFDSCPALRGLSFDGYHHFNRVMAHLTSCNPLTGLTRLDLSNCSQQLGTPATTLGNEAFSIVNTACPNLQELRLGDLRWRGPINPAVVFSHLTALVFDNSSTYIKGEHESLEQFFAHAPDLHAAMPRLQQLHMVSNSWCAPELITGCTSLQHVTLDYPAAPAGLTNLRGWMRAVGAAGVRDFSVSFDRSHFWELEIQDEPVTLLVPAHVFRWAQGLRGVRSLTFGPWDGSQSLAALLHPLAAGLAGSVLELTVNKCAIGTAEEAAAAFLCLPLLQRLERLTIDFDVPLTTVLFLPPIPKEDTLRALLAPLPALRVGAPALQSIALRLPLRAAAPRGTISWQLMEELSRANPGLSIEFC